VRGPEVLAVDSGTNPGWIWMRWSWPATRPSLRLSPRPAGAAMLAGRVKSQTAVVGVHALRGLRRRAARFGRLPVAR